MKTKNLISFKEPSTFVIVGSSNHGSDAKLLVENTNESSVWITDDYSGFEIYQPVLVGDGTGFIQRTDLSGELTFVENQLYKKFDVPCDGCISLYSVGEFKVWFEDYLRKHEGDLDEDLKIFIVTNCKGIDVTISCSIQDRFDRNWLLIISE